MDLRIEWLINDTYQVVEYENGERYTTWFQGLIGDCIAFRQRSYERVA